VDPAQVPATLQGIAAEVGRIESKVASVLKQPGMSLPDFGALFDMLQLLLTLLPQPVAGTTYSVQPPCGRAPGGGPLPAVAVAVADAENDGEAIIRRLDAIAELIDRAKQLRQPICKHKPTGEPVSITFEEV
jgi:hypothetical protein